MSRQFKISCDDLTARYIEQRQTAQQIARAYGCSASTVLRHMERCGIEGRDARYGARTVPERELRRLYLEERLPLQEVARQLGVSQSTILNRLRSYEIAPRPPITSKRALRALWEYGLSIASIAGLGGVGAGAVIYAIQSAERPYIHIAADLPPEALRAYLCGLRRCWLAAERSDDASGRIVGYRLVRDTDEQALFKNALGAQGWQGRVQLGQRGSVVVAVLPGNWSFLLSAEDRLPNWVRAEPALVHAFLAALIDGSGRIVVLPSPQIEIETSGRGMLRQISADLAAWKLSPSSLQLRAPAPHERWRLTIAGPGLGGLLSTLAPHLRHPARRTELHQLLRS